MTGRRRARQVVLQLIFQNDFQSTGSQVAELDFIANRLSGNDDLIVFAQKLLTGVRDHQQAIDDQVSASARNWSIGRMAPSDRSAIRLGAYEILFGDTPPPVAINEAIELAKIFGNEDSGKFVNGVLDRLNKDQAAAKK